MRRFVHALLYGRSGLKRAIESRLIPPLSSSRDVLSSPPRNINSGAWLVRVILLQLICLLLLRTNYCKKNAAEARI
jgi:hypothetical protein